MSKYSIRTKDDVQTGVNFLCGCEPRFGHVMERCGLPPLRLGSGGIKGLLEIITGQLISIQAAASIWARVEQKFSGFDFDRMVAASDEDYQACGLSRPKIKTIRALLTAIEDGRLDLAELENLRDTDVMQKLVAIKGIGPWTAQIYLLSGLGRSNVWPVGDLALQESARILFNLDARPDVRQMEAMAQDWQPWRAVAARLLWSYYRHVRFEGGEK